MFSMFLGGSNKRNPCRTIITIFFVSYVPMWFKKKGIHVDE